jgi:hypothetical protein
MPVTTQKLFPKLTFDQNTLNKYTSVDYRLRLTVMKDAASAFSYDPSRGITLAESATTSRFIFADLELKQNYSLTPNSRSSFIAGGTITIIDPSGFRFADAMVDAASTLGVKNGIVNARYLLEIEFVGHKEDGSVVIDTDRGVYVVAILKAEVRLTEKGGEFKLQFTATDGDALRHVNVTLQKTKTIQHAGHFKDFIKELETMLNDEEAKKVGRGEQEFPNKWKFLLEPYIESSPHFKFASQAAQQQFRDRTQRPMDGSNGQLNAAREGSTILQVIDNAMADTDAMRLGLNQDGTVSDPLKVKDQSTAYVDIKKIKQMYRIDSHVQLQDKWDSITNDYVREFYYYIFLQDADTSAFFYGPVNQLTPEQYQTVVKERLENAAYINHLRRKYDYYYTGLNSEILKFDLKAEFVMFVAEHLHREYSPGSGSAPGPGATGRPGQAPRPANAQPVSPTAPTNAAGRRLVYAEDAPGLKQQSTGGRLNSSADSGMAGGQVVFPHIFSYDNSNVDKGTPVENPSEDERRRMKFQHIYDAMSYTGPDFLRIQMTIRGDPYWFGSAKPIYTQLGLSSASGNPNEKINRANFFLGAQKLYVEVHSADLAAQDDSGLVPTNRTMSGVYTIVECKNRFVGGRFEQEISCTRDLHVFGKAMIDAIQNATTNPIK